MTQASTYPLRIGLTGGIGCGKTTVCNLFEQLGIKIIDADVIAHEIVEPNKPAYNKILETFSASKILTENRLIDRQKLRAIVFKDKNKLEQLEKITHPRIIKTMRDQVKQSTSDYCILCVPLLFEKKLEDEVDRVLVVDIASDIQKQRVVARDGNNINQIEAIMKHQLTREKRLALADDIIINDGSVSDLMPQVTALHDQYLSMETLRGFSIN